VTAFRVGLTGGLASGKSTVARWLGEAGFRVVDADKLVASLYKPGQPGARAVSGLFGPSFLTSEGAVDHSKLARRVFTDAAARHQLEAAIHPLVHQAFANIAVSSPGVVVYEATLLVESGGDRDMDLVVTVESSREIQLQRAVARGMAEESAESRLTAQGDGAQRRAAAGITIDNRGTLEELRQQVEDLVRRLRESGRS
jgi:dephospho-CoA kinase